MLHLPKGDEPLVNLIGIDPGSVNLGVGIVRVNLATTQIVASEAFTLYGTWGGRDTWHTEIHGERAGRIYWMRKRLFHLFVHYMPVDVTSESPFMNMRQPSAYGALTEVICAVRQALFDYDAWKVLNLIDPPTVKMAVGAKGNADKDVMKQKILELAPFLCWAGEIPITNLDEHSVDGLAVVLCRLKMLMGLICSTT